MKLQKHLTTSVITMNADTSMRGVRWGFAALVAVWIVAAVAATPAAAQVFDGEPIVVDNDGDEVGGEGVTLRAAIAQAEATAADDVIVFADHISTIHLTRGELWIGDLYMPPNSGWLMIDGGEQRVRIDAGGQSGILDIQSGSVIVKGLELVNGYASLGGGLRVWDLASVTLEDSLVSGNYATDAGGGIFSIGELIMFDTVVENNYSRDSGGGLHIDATWGGSLFAIESSFWDNEARGVGGGIFNCGAEVMLIAPNVFFNTARHGGGICNYGGHLSISDEGFAGNLAARSGGDIYYTTGSFDPADLEDPDALDIFEEKPKGKGGGRR